MQKSKVFRRTLYLMWADACSTLRVIWKSALAWCSFVAYAAVSQTYLKKWTGPLNGFEQNLAFVALWISIHAVAVALIYLIWMIAEDFYKWVMEYYLQALRELEQ